MKKIQKNLSLQEEVYLIENLWSQVWMISKDKVNTILKKFQAILNEEKPSLQELMAI